MVAENLCTFANRLFKSLRDVGLARLDREAARPDLGAGRPDRGAAMLDRGATGGFVGGLVTDV